MAELADKTVHTPVGDAPVIPVALMVSGLYLCWFGVHYWRTDTRWPTDPVKGILTGKGIPKPDRSADTASLQAVSQAYVPASSAGDYAANSTPGPSGSSYGPGSTHRQLMTLWTANGGSAATADIAAAIGMAESSGNSSATSANPDGGTNVGVWQLDTKGVGAGYSIDQLKDPNTNARITVMHTSNGTNWSAWETWHTGAYKKYL
jgi:hypothetical protein